MRPHFSHILPLSRGIRGGLLPLLFVLLAACSEWDTDSVGTSFTPANSVVRVYNNLVYIEYAAPEARVWGPAASDVTATISGGHVNIRSEAQNVAYFVYGYPAGTDTLGTTYGSLTFESRTSYALYREGLSLRCQDGPVFQSPGNDDCHIVLSRNAVNHLYGPIQVAGNLSLSGVGTRSEERRVGKECRSRGSPYH